MKKFKYLIGKLVPKIHDLPQVIYINWLGFEWIIRK